MRIVLFVLSLASCCMGCSSSTEEPYLLGHLAPLSGERRMIGEHQQRGIQLALEEISKDPGKAGGHSLHVVHVDSKGSLKQTRAEAIRMLSLSRVRCVLAGVPTEAISKLSTTVQGYQVPMITPASLMPNTPGPVLSLTVSPSNMAMTISRFVHEHLNISEILILSAKDRAYDTELATSLLQLWQKENRGANHQQYSSSLDWNKEWTTAKAVILVGTANDCRRMHQLLQEQNHKVPLIFSGESWEAQQAIVDPKLQGDIIVPAIYYAEKLNDQGKAFVNNYKAKYASNPGPFAIQGFEMIKLIAQALQKDESTTALTQDDEKKERIFDGVTGKITYKDEYALRPIYFLSLKEEKPTLLKTYDLQPETKE